MRQYLPIGLGALLVFGCSTADLCEPGDACIAFGYSNYRSVLNHVCEDACDALTECGENLSSQPKGDCEQACRNEATEDYYWKCEPRYRVLLDCYTHRVDCEESACSAELDAFTRCREEDLPANANSCNLANNGVCDEPNRCVTGSDTNDCSGPQ